MLLSFFFVGSLHRVYTDDWEKWKWEEEKKYWTRSRFLSLEDISHVIQTHSIRYWTKKNYWEICINFEWVQKKFSSGCFHATWQKYSLIWKSVDSTLVEWETSTTNIWHNVCLNQMCEWASSGTSFFSICLLFRYAFCLNCKFSKKTNYDQNEHLHFHNLHLAFECNHFTCLFSKSGFALIHALMFHPFSHSHQ